MDVDEAQGRMQEIQRIMERATLFTLLPGWPAVAGGLLVLAGCAVSYAMFRSLDFADILRISPNAQVGFCLMWFAIGAIGVVLEAVVTTRAAARQQLVLVDRHLRVAAFSLTQRDRGHRAEGKVSASINATVWQVLWTWNFQIPLMPKAMRSSISCPFG